ncbi:MAG: hypothetical protein IKE30_09985 [Clostridia bacterium]|nr:hypothetical protein [Clostridia bacterium]
MKRVFRIIEDSIRQFTVEGWNAQAYQLPREALIGASTLIGDEQAIYFLFCRDEHQTEGVYIGLTDHVITRLLKHCESETDGSEGFFWHSALIVCLNESPQDAQYLCRRLIHLLEKEGHCVNLAGQPYAPPRLTRPQRTLLDSRVEGIRQLLREIHQPCLEPIRHGRVLYLRRRR